MSTSNPLNTAAKVDFLDFSTLGARQRYCQEEVRLNRCSETIAISRLGQIGWGRSAIKIDTALQQVLSNHARCFAERVSKACIVEAHGDLRPEHIYLGNPPAIIDCLEFNWNLRLLDPVDALGFLAPEYERLAERHIDLTR